MNGALSPSMARLVDALEAAGCRPRPSSAGYAASCPLPGHAHGDKNPSLSLQYLPEVRRTRIRCHRCGDDAELAVVEAIGLGIADSYDQPKRRGDRRPAGGSPARSPRPRREPPAPTEAEQPRTRPPVVTGETHCEPGRARGRSERRIVARYDYLDDEGAPLLRALRYEPKAFSQQKWNGARWVPGSPEPGKRVLYRLPQVLAAARAGGTIHLSEGEKDAEAICAAGGVGTTAPMGAGKWQPQYAEQLRGAAQVLIHADRDYLKDAGSDDQGARHAVAVRDALRNAEIPCQVVEAAEGKDVADHLAAGLPLQALLAVPDDELERRAGLGAAAAGNEEVDEGTVLEHPTLTRAPAPGCDIPMARGAWSYESGGPGRRERGVYLGEEKMWRRVAPLPYVRARIVCRDGTGRRIGTQYLLTATEDGLGSVISTDDLRTAAWAPILGIPLSDDDKVQKAVSTAIRYAAEDVEEREATPRIVDGRVSVPVAESVPAGYLVTAPGTREEALATWRRIIAEAARSPRLALVLGAAAVAPFVAATRGQSHIVALYGDPAKGKSTALELAAAIWGNPTKEAGPSVVRPWNASGLAVPRFLGELGVLPAVLDEIGQATLSGPAAWGKLIYDVCEGGSRMVSAYRGHGVNTTMPWEGILISAGNGRLTDGLGAGRYAGVARRVVDIATPLTVDEAHADTLAGLAPVASGHLGVELLACHNAQTVRPLIEQAAALVGLPEDPSSRTIARHLHAHVAGAAMLDALAGTGTTLSNAALAYAREHLAELAPPEHDADRLLAEIRDAIGREPAMWPTLSAYEEAGGRKAGWNENEGVQSLIPVHGVNRTVCGIRADEASDEQWVGVFKATWRQMAEDLGLDKAVACRELHARGLLKVTESRRRRQEWASQVKVDGKPMELYKLILPVIEDEDPDNRPPAPQWPTPEPPKAPPAAPEPPVGGPVGGGRGSVGGPVGGSKPPLTCTVGGVGGKSDEASRTPARVNNNTPPPAALAAEVVQRLPLVQHRPCRICSLPAPTLVNGVALHTGECLAEHRRRRQPQPAADTAPPDAPTGPAAADQEPPTGGRTAPPPSSATTSGTAKEARWRAPAVVLDATTGYLPAGECVHWPQTVEHLGDLAMLAHRDQLRLGHGGGETYPEPGQIWLWDTATMKRLGLPAAIGVDGAEHLSQDAFDKATEQALAALDDHPMLTGAKAAGWQFGHGGHLHVFIALWHPELLPYGARIVVRPWYRLTSVALFEHSTDPAGLAQNLAQFAETVGIPYRISPAATALDLIDHTRPPRRSADGISGRNERRVAVVRAEPAELPGFLRNPDSRTRLVEADYSWWRPWTSLLEEEQSRLYVHSYDRGASYLAQWSGVQLGVDGLEHRTGAKAAWDGSEKPGYYLIDKGFEWPAWGLPQPTLLAVVEGGRVWVTSHTLRQLAAVGISPTVHECYTWQTTARYLDKAAQRLREGRQHPNPAVSATAKAAYAAGTGKLAERRHRDTYHLWRPDWRDHVIASSRTGILLTLQDIEHRCGDHALAVARDSIVFASTQADPVAAWPGDPGKLGSNPGQWKPEGTGLLAQWGPQHLPEQGRSRYWHHVDAIDALTLPT